MIFSRTSFSLVYHEPELLGGSSLASPFVDLTYSPDVLYYQGTSKNTLQAPHRDNKHHTQPVFTVVQHLFQTQIEAP